MQYTLKWFLIFWVYMPLGEVYKSHEPSLRDYDIQGGKTLICWMWDKVGSVIVCAIWLGSFQESKLLLLCKEDPSLSNSFHNYTQ